MLGHHEGIAEQSPAQRLREPHRADPEAPGLKRWAVQIAPAKLTQIDRVIGWVML